jgi:hypothetical protein
VYRGEGIPDYTFSLYLPDPLEKVAFLHIQLSRKQTLKIVTSGAENGQELPFV